MKRKNRKNLVRIMALKLRAGSDMNFARMRSSLVFLFFYKHVRNVCKWLLRPSRIHFDNFLFAHLFSLNEPLFSNLSFIEERNL